MTLTHPLNNNVLIEVIREDNIVSRSDDNESLRKGKVVEVALSTFHVTASSFGEFDDKFRIDVGKALKPSTIVRWEEFAEGGQTFEEDSKTYALIPWWRLISYES